MSIDTLSNVKTRLGITTAPDNDLLDLLRSSAEKWIFNYCGREFGGGTYTEYHPGGSEFVHLKNFPVQSVTSVKVDPGYVFGTDTLVSASSYVIHLERGVIQSLVGPFGPYRESGGLVNEQVARWTHGPRVVQVIYTVASSAVSDDILEAYAQLVGHWYRRVKTQVGAGFQNVTQQTLGEAGTSYTPAQIAGLPIPPDVFTLLAPHRVPNI